jgi:two-component system chemotaxis sensor kinase CheA
MTSTRRWTSSSSPWTGVLAGLSAYSGSALMGDGSVLMVLNVKEML